MASIHTSYSGAHWCPFTYTFGVSKSGRFFIRNCAVLRVYRTPTETPGPKPHHLPTLAQTDKKPAFRCAFLKFFSCRHWCPRIVQFATLIGVQMCFILQRFGALHSTRAAPVQARAATNLAPAPEIASKNARDAFRGQSERRTIFGHRSPARMVFYQIFSRPRKMFEIYIWLGLRAVIHLRTQAKLLKSTPI